MSVKVAGETVRGYKREQFEDSWLRYSPIPGVTGVTGVTSGLAPQADGNASNASNASNAGYRGGAEPDGEEVERLAALARQAPGEDMPFVRESAAEAEAEPTRGPIPGEPNFVLRVTGAYKARHLTRQEWNERLALHDAVTRWL